MFTRIEDCGNVVMSMLSVVTNVQSTSDLMYLLEELQHYHEYYASLIIRLEPDNQPILP